VFKISRDHVRVDAKEASDVQRGTAKNKLGNKKKTRKNARSRGRSERHRRPPIFRRE